VEPLLALYEPRCRAALESMALRGDLRLSRVAHARGVAHPRPPAKLVPAWRNVNRPAELRCGDAGPDGPGQGWLLQNILLQLWSFWPSLLGVASAPWLHRSAV